MKVETSSEIQATCPQPGNLLKVLAYAFFFCNASGIGIFKVLQRNAMEKTTAGLEEGQIYSVV